MYVIMQKCTLTIHSYHTSIHDFDTFDIINSAYMWLSAKTLQVSMQILAHCQSLKSYNSITVYCNIIQLCPLMATRFRCKAIEGS